MCGIFGIVTSKESLYTEAFLSKSIKQLALLSESRGKDSSGLCAFNQIKNRIEVVKGPIPIRQLFRGKELKNIVSGAFSKNNYSKYAFGHARLVTNGTQLNDANNQPVVKDGIVGVHNGIVVNVEELWKENPNINRENEIDTEVLLALVRAEINLKTPIEQAVSKSINKVFGTVATALVFEDLDKFILATNNGSLYVLHNNKDILFFASERFMLSEFEKKINISKIGDYQIEQIKSNNGVSINLLNYKIQRFSLEATNSKQETALNRKKYQINTTSIASKKEQLSTVVDLNLIHLTPNAFKEQALLEYPIEKIKDLKRCTKCILPETFPFIEFDDKGECNYCKNYKKKNQPKPIEELQKLIEPYRKTNNRTEVLVPYSGGRDSTYVLHIVKEILGLKPLTYTYDWGMVTDLARRNVSRTCGKLGVENIIVAADIHAKRRNVRLNISAWLKNPHLGMVPLFMAGDKYFFYYSNMILKQNNLELSIWGSNSLENTDFKLGFAGIKPNFNKKRIDDVEVLNKLKLVKFFGLNYLQNPSYFNSSLYDTFGSFLSRYLIKRNGYLQLFDYIKWDEQEIENVLINEYDWEKSIDSKSTWRIGDGTAAFYNYIYYTVAGFSEFDTFRSNQIREGQLTREKGLKLVEEENRPRHENLRWYIEIIGLDFKSTIERINQIAKLYK
jgi:asparagine synthetase B (glutamine-hydrolysing)